MPEIIIGILVLALLLWAVSAFTRLDLRRLLRGPRLLGARGQKIAKPTSRVRSAFVEMELDHETGAMRGRILAGRHEGATLAALDVATVVGFLPAIDDESRAL